MSSFCLSSMIALALVTQTPAKPAEKPAAEQPKAAASSGSLYDFTVKDIDGKDLKLDRFRGDVLLLVNTASKCGYTDKTYAGLEALHKKYKDKGLKIIAFPANNFGGQEPLDNAGIKQFCEEKKATFLTVGKVSVAGADQAPVFKYLTEHPNKEIAGKIEWNFEKYLVGRDGTVIAKFATRTLPEDPKVTEAIEKALAAKKP